MATKTSGNCTAVSALLRRCAAAFVRLVHGRTIHMSPPAADLPANAANATRSLAMIFALAAIAGCGVETATTAATGAAIKKQEIEQAKKTQEQVRQKVDQAMEQVQQRAEKDTEK